ncbi:MAG: hypothetical protein BWY14_01318 [Parcubacteria group bacterium ADurb.Bin192]|nr:MAG: hypothetical protein BWY14_01318 [Parcubacteria group bacterium ADurb.Bin192]
MQRLFYEFVHRRRFAYRRYDFGCFYEKRLAEHRLGHCQWDIVAFAGVQAQTNTDDITDMRINPIGFNI